MFGCRQGGSDESPRIRDTWPSLRGPDERGQNLRTKPLPGASKPAWPDFANKGIFNVEKSHDESAAISPAAEYGAPGAMPWKTLPRGKIEPARSSTQIP